MMCIYTQQLFAGIQAERGKVFFFLIQLLRLLVLSRQTINWRANEETSQSNIEAQI